ncbi:MAG: glycosyltransferase family 39 protein [Candidatus Helarchaeota archaeon]
MIKKVKIKKSRIILLFIILIGLVSRLMSFIIGPVLLSNLNSNIFPDEASFLVYAKYLLIGETPPIPISYHGSIIISSLIALFYSVFGVQVIVGRLISVIFGTLTIGVVYYFSRELFNNEKVAILSALFISISAVLRFWDIRALSDGPLTFFFVLSMFLFFKGLKSEKIKFFILAGISSVIAFLVKYPGFLVLIIMSIYFLIIILKRDIRTKKRKIFVNFSITIITFSVSIIFLLLSQFAIKYQPFLQIGAYIQGLVFQNTNFLYYILYLLSLNTVYGILMIIFLSFIIIYSIIKLNYGILLLLIWSIVVFIFFSLYGPSELYRYLLPAFPALYMLISYFFITTISPNLKIFRTHNNWFKKSIVLLLIMSLISFISLEITFGEYIIVKRSNTYNGVYNCSNWLFSNAYPESNIMAPSNALSQLEFYTSSNYNYYTLSSADSWSDIVMDLRNNHINYVIISVLQYPETQNLPICTLLPLHLTPIYNSTDGDFITYIYNTTGI